MSTSMILFQPGGVPAHILNNPNAVSLNAAAQQGIRLSFPILSIEGKVWSVVFRGKRTVVQASDGTDKNGKPLPVMPVRSLEVVVVGVSPHIHKAFYLTAYQNDGKFRLPDCFSANGERPDPTAANIQSELCSTCLKNQWESATNPDGTPAKGKACSDVKKIVVVPAADIDNATYGGPMMLRVPATSLQNLAKYGGQLDLAGYDMTQVVTSLSFDPAITHQVIMFTAIDFVRDAANYEGVCDWARSDIVRRMLDEMPEVEAGGILPPPPRPTREQFQPKEVAWIDEVREELDGAVGDPERWIEMLDDFACACASMTDLADLRVFASTALKTAPPAYRERIQKVFEEAVGRLSPVNTQEHHHAAAEPDSPKTEPTPPSEHDSDGIIWDPAIHASTKAKNSNGTWRARRGGAIPPASILENGQITPIETSANEAPAAMVAPATGERGSHDTPAAGAVAFSAWLVDHEGEGIGDDPHDKPVAWAEAYVAARDGMSDDQTEAFGINNSPALALAMGADKEVYNIVALTLPVTHAEPAATTSAFVPPPAKPTRAEYDAYQARFKETLATQTTLAGVDGFDTANLDVYGALPDKRRVECLAMISARRNEVDAPASQSLADLAAGMEKDIASLETIEKIDAWRKYQPVMDEFTKLLQGDPDLYHSVMNVADKRRKELAPKIAPELALYDELYARMMACETVAEVDALDADEVYRADVRKMHDLNPTIKPPLWVRLGEVGKQHKKKLEGAAG